MATSDPYGEWVIRGGKQDEHEGLRACDEELLAAARAAWPHALAHARRELSDRAVASDRIALAEEVWESVLRSVSRTRQRSEEHGAPVVDLQAYLIGAFHIRLNRIRRREQKRAGIFEMFPSALDLEKFETAKDVQWAIQLEQAIAVKTILAHMDESTRRIWRARQAGYSWKEIAEHLGVTERHAKRKLRGGMDQARQRLIELMRRRQRKCKNEG
jgi:DNA-directed RNA polymerase specialized sigma24 family protein